MQITTDQSIFITYGIAKSIGSFSLGVVSSAFKSHDSRNLITFWVALIAHTLDASVCKKMIFNNFKTLLDIFQGGEFIIVKMIV